MKEEVPTPTVPGDEDGEPGLREQLSSLHGLLVLSMLMTESGDDRQILHLASTAVPSLGRCRLAGVYLSEVGWRDDAGDVQASVSSEEYAAVRTQLTVLGSAGGAVAVTGAPWGWAFPLRSLEEDFGYLVTVADNEPTSSEQFLLRVLAQQAGIALANARSHRRERAAAAALRSANATLNETVAALERSTAIHDRLTQVAVAGEGQEGIAHAVHELTGFPVAIEDRHGNLVTWAGPGRLEPYPKESPARRQHTLEQLQRGTPVRRAGRVVCLARPRPDVVGVIALIDSEQRSGPGEQVALEHGATVLAMELARAHSVAEAELRLGRDLAEELLAGADEAISRSRANALGYDLFRPHRVVLVRCAEVDPNSDDGSSFFHAVRRAARDTGVGTLQVARQGTVVVLSRADGNWHQFRAAVEREYSPGSCRVAVGGRCDRPADFPRSYREAHMALELQSGTGSAGESVVRFDDLGVFRILLTVEDTTGIERFVHETLGTLLEYDAERGSSMVGTLSAFLESGGNYDMSAHALSVHRSTLKYRLKRIEEISGHDLSAAGVRFNLQLATRSWQSLQSLRT
ncbi:MAG TPA: helix-turn-helix domain-containing protein [Acidimicrobiales bacterium]|nr:helix-turn-helix domain-containing protein [Acidimicrobiales bacterium]